MKKTLICTILLTLTHAAFAAEPSFKDMKELEAVNGYMLYGSDYKDLDKAYIFVDGSKKDGKIASISMAAVYQTGAGFALTPAKTLAEYMKNADKAEFYQTLCAEQAVRKIDLKNKTFGEPVPFAKLKGVTKAAAGASCLVEAGQKESMENSKK
ncbi:MAG: hypothetical protein ACFNVM_06920 [Neisseria elongata]